MSASLTLTDIQLSGLIQDLLSAGTAVLAPAPPPAPSQTGGLDYRPITAWREANPSGATPKRPAGALPQRPQRRCSCHPPNPSSDGSNAARTWLSSRSRPSFLPA